MSCGNRLSIAILIVALFAGMFAQVTPAHAQATGECTRMLRNGHCRNYWLVMTEDSDGWCPEDQWGITCQGEYLVSVTTPDVSIIEPLDYQTEQIEPLDLHQLPPPTTITADSDGWDCSTMGNKVCGPGWTYYPMRH